MSREVFKDILMRQCSYLRKNNQIINNHDQNKKVAVIVEPRRHEMLESVIRNFMYFLGESWNLILYTYEDNIEWVRSLFPGSDFNIVPLPFPNMNQLLYSFMLMDIAFWKGIREEHILIFQTDCILFKKGIDNYLEYDYVGANFTSPLTIAPRIGGIQGGLSLRRKSAMIKCIENFDWETIQNYRTSINYSTFKHKVEDIYFTYACDFLNLNVLPVSERDMFSIECEYYDKPIGHHGSQHDHYTKEQAMAIISQCEDLKGLYDM